LKARRGADSAHVLTEAIEPRHVPILHTEMKDLPLSKVANPARVCGMLIAEEPWVSSTFVSRVIATVFRQFGFAAALFAAIAVMALAASAEPRQGAGPAPANVANGHDLFVYYCASCHGRDARGGGPAAPSLKISPPDLTLVTRRYGGIFPTRLITALLTNGDRDWLPSHGSKDMPVWGPILGRSSGNAAAAEVRVESLVAYLRTIQLR
jgi:mono/diheme cytochrome c family protein